jgi:glyoxylase-like metal-dependent hydrolase (beta-lactamase superfamily II)
VTNPVPLPLPVPYLGTVNVWLLPGEPLTLIDTGPANEDALDALETGLAAHGLDLGDVDLVLLTHHHLDHAGLAASIRARSGARIAAHASTAQWGRGYHARAHAEREFTRQLMTAHGVPRDLIEASEPFFEHIVRDSRDYETDLVLAEGDTVVAGGRTLRAIHRPGHSSTDTLYLDVASREAFVGDHLLAEISSGAEIMPEAAAGRRRRALAEYLDSLLLTRASDLARCYPGHGPMIDDHRTLIDERLRFHDERLQMILGLVGEGHENAFDIARALWSPETAETQPVLVIWEIVGHLDILVHQGAIAEDVPAEGTHRFHVKEADARAAAST